MGKGHTVFKQFPANHPNTIGNRNTYKIDAVGEGGIPDLRNALRQS